MLFSNTCKKIVETLEGKELIETKQGNRLIDLRIDGILDGQNHRALREIPSPVEGC